MDLHDIELLANAGILKKPDESELENTLVSYLYRDGSNYKTRNAAVIRGRLSEAQISVILDSLDEGEYFIPRQVGLPEERFGALTEDDHPWFSLGADSFTPTAAAPTEGLDAAALTSAFAAAKGNWDTEAFYSEFASEMEEA